MGSTKKVDSMNGVERSFAEDMSYWLRLSFMFSPIVIMGYGTTYLFKFLAIHELYPGVLEKGVKLLVQISILGLWAKYFVMPRESIKQKHNFLFVGFLTSLGAGIPLIILVLPIAFGITALEKLNIFSSENFEVANFTRWIMAEQIRYVGYIIVYYAVSLYFTAIGFTIFYSRKHA